MLEKTLQKIASPLIGIGTCEGSASACMYSAHEKRNLSVQSHIQAVAENAQNPRITKHMLTPMDRSCPEVVDSSRAPLHIS